MADAATSQDAGPDTPALGAPEEPPMTPHFGATSSSALAAGAGGVVLSETQLGSMALRAKQQRTKAEQDKQLLQVRPYATHWAPPARSLGTLPASKWCSLSGQALNSVPSSVTHASSCFALGSGHPYSVLTPSAPRSRCSRCSRMHWRRLPCRTASAG